MEGSVRSGGVLKKQSSSGCLIIKNKRDDGNSGGGLGGFSDSGKERKRVRGVASFSRSSDEEESLELMRRKVTEKRLHNGSVGYRRDELENREQHMDNAEIGINGDAKRSRLDLFEFDEYDEFDGRNMRNLGNRFKVRGRSGKGHTKEFGVGSSNSNSGVGKRQRDSDFGGSNSGRSKRLEHNGSRDKGLELEDDEANMPISLLKLKCQENTDQPIRFQGKNGVLKVMVNKKKKADFPSHADSYDGRDIKERKGCTSDDGTKKDLLARSPICSATKLPENHGLSIVEEEIVAEKKERNLEKIKPVLNKGSKSRDSEIDGPDMVLKPALPGVRSRSSKKGMEKEDEESPTPENFTLIKGGDAKEGKVTEKQMLREKIRGMLIEAGWTIDYRPRRNRDYLDAVYIKPSGTAYWSIIKAYDAFKKQLEEDNGKSDADDASPLFSPLSEDLINKLTRQTKKKIKDEMKRKRQDGMAKSAKRSAVREAADISDSDQSDGHMKQNYKPRSGKMRNVDQDNGYDSDHDLPKRKSGKVGKRKSYTSSKSSVIQGRASKVIGRCTLLVRPSDKGEDSDSDGYVPYRGKRTILAWLIDTGAVKSSENVQYMNRKRNRAMLNGWITRDGIHCSCCSNILTVSKFELHAGSKLRQPFQNIFLESGSSLLQCQIDAWNSLQESASRDFNFVDDDGIDPDDDTCGICGDGGDLICCDSCPSTFHQLCLEIQNLPSGDWYCPNCTCKFCGHAGGDVSDENDTTGDKLNTCSFCEKKYHKLCMADVDAPSMSSSGASFCGIKCQALHDHLQKILGVKHELEGGFSWTLIQRMNVADASHHGFAQRVECNSKLAVALSVMDECFLPIIDRRSGINVIHNVVYNCGSNFNRLNFRGFYTVILERGDEIVSASSIRLHGTHLAEMPFIGTRETYRRKGMCRRLLSAIENELALLKVEKLIIPAISEHTNTWTAVFGFHELEDIDKKEIKSMNMLVLPGTDMLRKQLIKQENSDGLKVSKTNNNQLQSPVLENSKIDSSPECNRQASNDSIECHESKSNDGTDAPDCSSPPPDIPSSDDTSPIAAVSESDNIHNNEGTTVIVPEVENPEKESSSHMKCFPASAESNDVSDMEQQLLDHPANVGSSKKDDVSEKNLKNGCISLGSVSDTSSQSTAVNGQSDPASCLKTLDGEEPLERCSPGHSQEIAPALETDLHPSLEHSAVTTDEAGGVVDSSTIHNVDDNNRCDHTASSLDVIVHNPRCNSDSDHKAVEPIESIPSVPTTTPADSH